MKFLSINPFVLLLDNFFSPEECQNLIKQTEALSYQDATVTVDSKNKIYKMIPEVRNNQRVFYTSDELAESIFKQIKPYILKEYQGKRMIGLNNHFRFYKYQKGQTFNIHKDGAFYLNDTTKSELTFLIYLSEDFVGGETSFYTEDQIFKFKVKPKIGQVLIFDHNQYHSGDVVQEGIKYVLRTDVMYIKE